MQQDLDNPSYLLSLCDKLLTQPQSLTTLLPQSSLITICQQIIIILKRQPMLLRLQPPINICGDVHGQFYDLRTIFSLGGNIKDKQRYLFLGDYVDRGENSVECIVLLFLYKIVYPNSIYLLRGNHEDRAINKIYGFYLECQNKFSVQMWETFNGVFDYMPVVAIVGQKIFCCHGGISPELQNLKQIKDIKRPTSVPDEGLLCDLLWADPMEKSDDWGKNENRNAGCTFGGKVTENFLKQFDFSMICRAHEYVENGHEFKWGRKVVTVFSASNYLGIAESKGAIMVVAKNLDCNVIQYDSKGQVVNSNNSNNKKNKNKK